MNMHELLTPEEESSWRQKGLEKASEKIAIIKETTGNPKERFKALHAEFNALDPIVEKCGNHFDEHDNYAPKDCQDEYSADEVVRTYGCLLKATEMRKAYCHAMVETKLSHVNGTSEVFNQCVQKLGMQPTDFAPGKDAPGIHIVLSESMIASYK